MIRNILLALLLTLGGANSQHTSYSQEMESLLSSRSELQGLNDVQMEPRALTAKFSSLVILTGGCILSFFLIWASVIRFSEHLRHLANLNLGTQNYFVPANPKWAWLKKHVIYAPLFRMRHNREFRLSSASNFGTLPTRFQTVLLTGIIVMNIAVCCATLPYRGTRKEFFVAIRFRTGHIAVVNLVPMMIMAGRNNPLIKLLNVSFDTWNLLHRWLGRIMIIESLIHALIWTVQTVDFTGWEAVHAAYRNSYILQTGIVATVVTLLFLIHSPSAVRHAFYEVFLHCHIIFAAIFFGCMWGHVKNSNIPRYYLAAAVIIWISERAARFIRLIYLNLGNGGTTALVQVLPGEAMHVKLTLARPWVVKPGQHLYLYLPSIGLWTSHPFTVAWSDNEQLITEKKVLPTSQDDILEPQQSTISLVIRRRTGLTNQLYERACERVSGCIALQALVEGPYGTENSLSSYGTVLLFAAGVGITHHIPYIRQLVAGYSQGTVAARRVTLVWIIQSLEHLDWVKPWLTEIMSMEGSQEVLKVMLFISRPRNMRDAQCSTSQLRIFCGKPSIGLVLDGEIERQIGAMGVLVCGTGSLSDDVRKACRERQTPTHVDFIEESFTW